MIANEINEELARKIINLLAENNVTVKDANEILSYSRRAIENNSNVKRIDEKLFAIGEKGEKDAKSSAL